MVTRKIIIILFSLVVSLTVSSCASLFVNTIPYSERENYLFELKKERKFLESLQDKVSPSELDMALRLNLTLQNAIREGREPRYVLFLYRIYAQKLTDILESGGIPPSSVKMKREEEISSGHPKPVSPQKSQFQGYPESQTETQIPPPPSAPKCNFQKAMEDYNNQDWEDAYQEFQKCVEAGEEIDKAGNYLNDIEQRVILPDWNRANLLVYQGRSESNPDRKREFLEKAEEILKGLLEKYPNNRYTPQIEKNIELIEKMLEKL